jgi:hypothetical protein
MTCYFDYEGRYDIYFATVGKANPRQKFSIIAIQSEIFTAVQIHILVLWVLILEWMVGTAQQDCTVS